MGERVNLRVRERRRRRIDRDDGARHTTLTIHRAPATHNEGHVHAHMTYSYSTADRVNVCTRVYACVNVCTRVYACVHVCTRVYTCVHVALAAYLGDVVRLRPRLDRRGRFVLVRFVPRGNR